MIIYNKLIEKMKENNVLWKDLLELKVVSSATSGAIRHNKSISINTLDRLCEFFQCQPSDLIEWIPNNTHNIEQMKKERKIAELERQLKELKG